MSLSEFVDRHENGSDTPIHSNVYAKAAHGDKIGSMNAQSFNDRLRLEGSRKSVRGYGHSLIGSGYVKEAAQQRIGGERGGSLQAPARTASPRPRSGGLSMPQRTFREPPTRYNPYG